MFRHYYAGAPAPLELVIWGLAERFGWTLDEIDRVPLARLHELDQIDDGRMKAESVRRKIGR